MTNQDTAEKTLSNKKPMSELRARKRAKGLRPVEMWVHTSRTKAEIKAAELQLQEPLNTQNPNDKLAGNA